MSRSEAGRLLNLGLDRQEAGAWDEALALYLRAAEVDPSFSSAWYNAGLIHKWRHQWAPALDCLRKAASVESSDDPSILWNLGIAATAEGAWIDAFRAWRGLKMPIRAAEDGSPALIVGVTPIRLHAPGGEGAEVVWADRFDPVRARLLNIPTPESGHRWQDVVLHDAEPKGKRERDGKLLSVFDALERLEPSPYATWTVTLEAAGPSAVEALVDELHAEDHHGEDWSESLEILCTECSYGVPHEHPHRPSSPAEWKAVRRFGIATDDGAAAECILERWRLGGPGRSWRDLALAP